MSTHIDRPAGAAGPAPSAASPRRALSKDHLQSQAGTLTLVGQQAADLKQADPLVFWTLHTTKPYLVDLREFAEGTLDHGDAEASFGARRALIEQIAPAFQARHRLAAPRTIDTIKFGLRKWWRLFDAIEAHAPGRTVVLTGDIHSAWATMLARAPFEAGFEPGRDALAVEFVAPGVTSPFPLPPTIGAALARSLPETHPHVAWANLSHRGFFTLELSPERVAADWYILDGVLEDEGELSFAMGADVAHGQSVITLRELPLPVRVGVERAP